MTKEALLEKIEALPPEKKAEVEDFVDFLAGRRAPADDRTSPKAHLRELVATIEASRDRLLKRKGSSTASRFSESSTRQANEHCATSSIAASSSNGSSLKLSDLATRLLHDFVAAEVGFLAPDAVYAEGLHPP